MLWCVYGHSLNNMNGDCLGNIVVLIMLTVYSSLMEPSCLVLSCKIVNQCCNSSNVDLEF